MLVRMPVPPSVHTGEDEHFAAVKLGQLVASYLDARSKTDLQRVCCQQQEIVSKARGRAVSLKKESHQRQGQKGKRNVVLGEKLCILCKHKFLDLGAVCG